MFTIKESFKGGQMLPNIIADDGAPVQPTAVNKINDKLMTMARDWIFRIFSKEKTSSEIPLFNIGEEDLFLRGRDD